VTPAQDYDRLFRKKREASQKKVGKGLKRNELLREAAPINKEKEAPVK